ncbi:MAG: cupin domain-containing protein [Oscillospiraceae bacterium]|nr:cupin domain-containing protein [Oscillospiraceae bacterium]
MYEKLVFEFPMESNEAVAEGDDPGFVIKPQAYFRGASQIPGAKFNVGFQIFVKPFFLDRMPHYHENEEYLIFLGGTFPNVFDFDAEVEFTLGKGEDAEKFVITKPTIVRVPAGVYHCPLNFKRVDKPLFFQAALMEGMFGGIYDMPDGSTSEMRYNGPMQCKYDKAKKCDACGKCLQEEWGKGSV